MQDTLLRVLLVALGLFMYPKENPMVEDDITTVMQDHRERLMREAEELDQEIAPINQEMTHIDTHIDSKGPWDDAKNVHMAQNQPTVEFEHVEKAKGAFLEDVALTNKNVSEDVYPKLDPSMPSKSSFEPETGLKTSRVDHEDQLNVLQMKARSQLDKESSSKERTDIQTGSVGDSSSLQRQKEKPGEVFILQQVSPSDLTETSAEGLLDMAITDSEQDYLWYIWNTFSIISMCRFFMKYLKQSQTEHEGEASASPVNDITSDMPLPDSDTLQRFYTKCIQVSPKWWEDEFLEGFVNDLLGAMRTICDGKGNIVIEGFQMVNGCNIIVPFSPPEPYTFHCLVWNQQASDLLPDMKVCGQIKLVENVNAQNGCKCQTSGVEDVVCLLHCDTKTVHPKVTDVYDGLLCMNTPFLSKSKVTKWFQSTIKQAWTQISHKYEFELKTCNVDGPGALVVRFRSGKKISFSINPVVKFSTGAHFFCSPNNLDILWSLSTTIYEDQVFDQVSKSLPGNSCHIQTLEIAYFLNRRQKALSGSSALKDIHFKTALMHLLLTKAPSQWQPKYLACRLQDLLVFMEKSLKQKLMFHFLIGNPFMLKEIDFPASFSKAKPVNLFHPLVVHNCIYTNAIIHFQELLRNANMLIQDYVNHV